MLFTTEGEEFLGIGMEKPVFLQRGEIVISDGEKLVAVYPHRDADNTKITEKTKNVVLLVCGFRVSEKKLYWRLRKWR